MNSGGEAAEQIIRISLEGVEVAAKITGAGAKNIAILLYSILKQQGKTKGKARLASMLRSGKELKVFTVKQEDLKKFTHEAGRYGVLYCVVADKRNKDPNATVDVIARAEDASKINRIVERFELAAVDTGAIINEAEKSREKKGRSRKDSTSQAEPEVEKPEKAEKDQLLDELMGNPAQKESNSTKAHAGDQAFFQQTAEKSPPSGHISEKPSRSAEGATMTEGKPSVKKELEKIKQGRKKLEADSPAREKNATDKNKNPASKSEHKQPAARKKAKKQKEAR